LLVLAVGVTGFEPAERARFFRLMQMEALPEQGEYFTDFWSHVQKTLHREPTEQELADFDRAQREPWSSREIPLVANWLATNKKALELIVSATRRPRCYLPLVESPQSGLLAIQLPVLQNSRDAARALAARAMLQLKEGRVSDSEQDLQTCHRLARLIGQTPFLMGALVAIAIDAVAYEGDARLIEYGHLSAERALAYQQELRKLAPLPVMADVIDVWERFVLLDTVSQLARDQSNPLDVLTGQEGSWPWDLQLAAKIITHRSLTKWDDALRFANEEFDKAVAAARKPTVLERKKAFNAFERQLAALRPEFWDPGKLGVWFFTTMLRRDMGRQVGVLLTFFFMPSLSAGCDAENRARTRETFGQLGFALAAYRADRGAYPQDLSVLAPRYIARVPNDLFTEQPLHYKRQEDGFLLYSVGANGVDNGGSTFDSQPPGDDIVLQIPHASAKKR
jgi:hypothetical protein